MSLNGPLAGVRVIELAGIGPCPMAAMLLAELGAEVVKIDRVTPSDLGVPVSKSFLDRSRRSLGIDLKNPEGVELLLTLIEHADVLIEGFRPGVTERLGLGPDICAERNQKLVYGRVTGWGQSGPLSRAAGHDLNYIAITGALHSIGRAGQPSTPPLNLVGDFGGGALYLALGVVSALYEAKSSGRGQVVDAAMVDGAASLMTGIYGLREDGHFNDQAGVNLLDSGAHFYDVYQTSDGKQVAVAPIEEKFYRRFLELIGVDSEEIPHTLDRTQWPELKEKIAAVIATRTREQWTQLLEGTDACFAPVLSMREAPFHPHNQQRQTFVQADGAWQPNAAPRFSRTPSAVKGPPTQPGLHSRSVLHDWGVACDQIDRLIASGIVVQHDEVNS